MNDIRIERQGRVGWLIINRPEKANTLRHQSFDELHTALVELEADPETRIIVIRGAGDRAFSGGIDLTDGDRPATSRDWDRHTKMNSDLCHNIWYADKPVVAAVNGVAVGTGCVLALSCDMIVAADNARFGEPEIRHGNLSPMLLLPWLTHSKLMHEFYYSGDTIGIEEANRMGLINRVVPLAQLDEAAQEFASRLANAPGYSLTLAKRSIKMTYDIMGFKGAQGGHRYIDNYLLDSCGDPDKESLNSTLRARGMKAFLAQRDGPYKS